MQKKILFLLFGILLVFVVVLLLFLLNSSNVKSDSYYKTNQTTKDKNSYNMLDKNNWIQKLSTYKKSDYLFPVREFFLSINFTKQKKRKQKRETKYYSLVIPDMSNYSLFCVLQILNKNQVPYMIENDYEHSKIFVRLDKKKRVDSLLSELERYNIFPKMKQMKQ